MSQTPQMSQTSGMSGMSRAGMIVAGLCVTLCMASSAGAQSSNRNGADEQRARAIERCNANRGVDCTSAAGLEEWVLQERPITDRAQAVAAGARRHREQCQKSKGGAGC